MWTWCVVSLLIVIVAPCASYAAQGAGAEDDGADAGAVQALDALLDDVYAALLEDDPLLASRFGHREHDARLPDRSEEAFAERAQRTGRFAARAAAIDRDALPAARCIDLDLLRYELALQLEERRFFPERFAVTQQAGPQLWFPQVPEALEPTTRPQLESYVARLEELPRLLAQETANLRRGLAEGRTPPRAVLGAVPGQALAQAAARFVERPETHPNFAPFQGLAADDPLRERARHAIADEVVPAFAAFGTFLRDEYVPACRATLAASALPDGAEYYAHELRVHTSLDTPPLAIHEIGLAEVARIRAEMQDVIARSDFDAAGRTGDASFAAFVDHLRTAPRFYFGEPAALLDAYRALCKRIDGELPRMFELLPRLPYGVKPLPAFLSPAAPAAYYYEGSPANGVAGNFMVNTHRLDMRPKYEMVPLALHEAVPGHHLQVALAQELADLHPWRRTLGTNAFVEGWALYAERLGLEMGDGERGLYADPYDDFGRLSFEMWRALRLVVDPGIHALGWTREQAIDFMLANSALSRVNVESEVDRYIAWPGQACGYKLGELKIRDLRRRAEASLGERFDLRAFHRVLLEAGALPLPILERRVTAWIDESTADAEENHHGGTEQHRGPRRKRGS